MIRFIEGSIDVKCENGIVIKNNGMGYFIHVPETSSFHRKEYGDIVKGGKLTFYMGAQPAVWYNWETANETAE